MRISLLVSQISYSKGGIKEKFRDIPWQNLEYLRILIGKIDNELTCHICDVAFPLIVTVDLPELLERLQQIQTLNKLLLVSIP